ncbi:MAG: hypothetical protein JRJ87_07130 [Deltaproteobacteria bacterium]|nr:hypothetical protein [Deltaproteobacteria bacterium]
MLDLVHEEEIVTQTSGMAFEQLLQTVDAVSPANLSDVYDQATDRYMVLAGKGTRTREENLELDRLDSSLRMVLGESGLLTFAARLIMVIDSARLGVLAFKTTSSSVKDLNEARLTLGLAAATCRENFKRTPIPVNSKEISELFARASSIAATLSGIRSSTPFWRRLFGFEQVAGQTVARLLDQLDRSNSGNEAWLSAQKFLNPKKISSGERIERVNLCYQLSGLAACYRILLDAGEGFSNAAELVKGGLGA